MKLGLFDIGNWKQFRAISTGENANSDEVGMEKKEEKVVQGGPSVERARAILLDYVRNVYSQLLFWARRE